MASIISTVIGLPLFVLGLLLLKRGRWPRRVGDAPHCRFCEYSLIGLTSDRCPECGSAISPRTIVHGQRVRRPDLAFGGIGMIAASLLLAAPIAIHITRSINWYRATPTFMLLRQA